jgi:hypothetical protein
MYRSICSLLLSVWLLVGCMHSDIPVPEVQRSEQIAELLNTLGSDIPREEVQRLSEDILYRAAQLEHAFGRTTSPWIHNFMINVGLKKKGLCYHYADGLYTYLKERSYPHFDFHLVGAHIGEYWREHNALLVTARNGMLEEGVIIDPWRVQGKVFVSKMKEDKAYRWVHRPERECR